MNGLTQGATWSSSDFPYMCLKDRERTEAFRDAIRKTIQPNDLVIELGAGSGILSFFAAASGASRVIAVEIDPLLAYALRRSTEANGFSHIIEVVEGDVLSVALPCGADVVIAEMIDTALIDEMEIPALNRLHLEGLITEKTTILPGRYTTYAQLVSTSFDYYGMTIIAPKHDWPFYKDDTWHPTHTSSAGRSVVVTDDIFGAGRLAVAVDEVLNFEEVPPSGANALRLHGTVTLTENISLGATNALNGDKILPLNEVVFPDSNGRVTLQVCWERGAGLRTFRTQMLR